MAQYTVTLTYGTEADNFDEASEDFIEYLRCDVRYFITITEDGPNGEVLDVTEMEVRR